MVRRRGLAAPFFHAVLTERAISSLRRYWTFERLAWRRLDLWFGII
jgi:hypothetical protein